MTVQTDQAHTAHLQTHETHPDIPDGWVVSRYGGLFGAKRIGVFILTRPQARAGFSMTIFGDDRDELLKLIDAELALEAELGMRITKPKDSD